MVNLRRLLFNSIYVEKSIPYSLRGAWVRYHCISPAGFYFVVQILSLSLSPHPPPTHISSTGCALERLAGGRRALGRRIHGDGPLARSLGWSPRLSLLVGNAASALSSASVAAAHLQSEIGTRRCRVTPSILIPSLDKSSTPS